LNFEYLKTEFQSINQTLNFGAWFNMPSSNCMNRAFHPTSRYWAVLYCRSQSWGDSGQVTTEHRVQTWPWSPVWLGPCTRETSTYQTAGVVQFSIVCPARGSVVTYSQTQQGMYSFHVTARMVMVNVNL